MHNHSGLSRSRTSQDQAVGFRLLCNQALLKRVAQTLDNSPIRLFRGRSFKNFLATGKVTTNELQFREREIGEDETQGIGEFIEAKLRVLMDDMNLEVFLVVVFLKRLEILIDETPLLVFRINADRHCRAKNSLATIKNEHPIVVQIEEPSFDRRQIIF